MVSYRDILALLRNGIFFEIVQFKLNTKIEFKDSKGFLSSLNYT